MKIHNIMYNASNHQYAIKYSLDDKTLKTIMAKCTVHSWNGTELPDSFYDKIEDVNWLSNREDSVWLNSEEYLIPIFNLYPADKDDTEIAIGELRYYITNHFDSTLGLALCMLDKPDDLDANDMCYMISEYLK